ncbi:MAG TPA: AzlC family ABC transporter permease [Solirubrobacteraceae bacterium]|nr:AzlC family ABC transporter permease [Solirubrobacteraceae bacterium]
MPRERFWEGFRAAVPYAIAGFVLSMSFGVLARDAGFSVIQAIVMSAVVFAGSAQFTALTVVAAGGSVGAAVTGAALMNSRFLPMGIALAPSLPGRALVRGAQGQAVVDSSWAMALRDDGRFDRWFLFGGTAVQYMTWSTGTILGAFASGIDVEQFGLDALYPTFFLALLIAELRSGRAKGAAALGALVALALVPVAPPGIPILVASLASLLGLWRREPA